MLKSFLIENIMCIDSMIAFVLRTMKLLRLIFDLDKSMQAKKKQHCRKEPFKSSKIPKFGREIR